MAAAWFAWGVAGCVVAVATFLFSRLTAWPPHEDETLALFVGGRPLGQLLDIVLEERGGAPLHYLLAGVAAHSGGGLTALRLGSARLRSRASRSSRCSSPGWPGAPPG